jgi:hypothetical protein
MDTALSPREQRLSERKNKAVEALSAQFSRNGMELGEFERLAEYIHKAESERELAIIEKIVDESADYAGLDRNGASVNRDAAGKNEAASGGLGQGADAAFAGGGAVGGGLSGAQSPWQPAGLHGLFGGSWTDVAFFASREISGDLLAAKRRSFLSFFGSTVITIGEGQLPPGKTVVNASAFFGNTVISVPPNVSITLDVNAILGNAAIEHGERTVKTPSSPELIVTGGACLGNIVVQVQKPKTGRAIGNAILDILQKR